MSWTLRGNIVTNDHAVGNARQFQVTAARMTSRPWTGPSTAGAG